MTEATVAIPVRDGGLLLESTLAALAQQTAEFELLVCDSGSRDGSVRLARQHGARVIEIATEQFNHGGTRNLLMREASGSFVAFLTQDAEPVNRHWLEYLLDGFNQADDVALVFGPYRPRPDAPALVARELELWFGSLKPGATRLSADMVGRAGFFTDANACIARAAWERVPFREIGYAEDRALALDMLHAGYAKVYEPRAPVWHSHAYGPLERFRRAFDEWRGLQDVYGHVQPATARELLLALRGELGLLRRDGAGVATLAAAAGHHSLRLAGAVLGSRAERLPPSVVRRCSLEGRIR